MEIYYFHLTWIHIKYIHKKSYVLYVHIYVYYTHSLYSYFQFVRTKFLYHKNVLCTHHIRFHHLYVSVTKYWCLVTQIHVWSSGKALEVHTYHHRNNKKKFQNSILYTSFILYTYEFLKKRAFYVYLGITWE